MWGCRGLGPGVDSKLARAGKKGHSWGIGNVALFASAAVTHAQLETQVSVCKEDRPTRGEGKSSEGCWAMLALPGPWSALWSCGCPVGVRVTLAPLLDSLPPGVNPREECKVQEKLYLGSCA